MSNLMRDPSLGISAALWELLERYHFDPATFLRLREAQRNGQAGEAANRLRAPLLAPMAGDVVPLPMLGSPERAALTAQGCLALGRGELALVVLAGGMATRFGGVVKAGVEVVPGHTFLQLKLADVRQVATRCKAAVPVYLMTSFATDAALVDVARRESCASVPVHTFSQFISLRLTPAGELFRDARGEASPYAPGHGDFAPALRRSGILGRLRAQGIRYVALTNIDNLAATLDPALLGLHIAQQVPMSFEVVARQASDVGGTPARVGDVLQIVEGLREPSSFVRSSIPLFCTNCLWFDADALDADFPLDWFAVTKQVAGQTAVQFERFVNQLSAFLGCRGLLVQREGPDARFSPVKDPQELERTRDWILGLLAARGVAL